MKNKKLLAHMITILLMFIWGASYLAIKVVVAEVDPTLSAFYRFIIASIILVVLSKTKYKNEKILKEDKWKVALGGLFGVAIYFFLENYAVHFTTASNVSILIASIPVFTLVAQKIVFKEEMNFNKILGVTLSFVGIILVVSTKGDVSLFSTGTLGDVMALCAALCWVVYNIITSKFKGNYSSMTITTYQILWGTLFLSPCLLWSKPSIPSTKTILCILYLGIVCSFLAYLMYIFVLNELGATIVSTYINLQPIISLALAFILLNESITFYQCLGCFIIISGVFLVNIKKKDKVKSIES